MSTPSTHGRFHGKVLLVTGGASGIGNAVAADVSSEDDVARAVDATAHRFGRIDAVLNAAGHTQTEPLEDFSYHAWTKMLAVHAGGTFLFCKHAAPYLRRTGGSIVNIASTAAIVAQPNNFAYGAAKGAIAAFSRQIALHLASDVRVNVVAPGRTRTGMTTPLYTERGGGDYDEGARISAADIPQQHIAEPNEIAETICFLLSPQASFMTGTTLVVDGGETAT